MFCRDYVLGVTFHKDAELTNRVAFKGWERFIRISLQANFVSLA